MKDNEVMKLSNDQANNTEGILTYKEISNTLYKMKSDESWYKQINRRIFQSLLEKIRPFCS